MLKYIFKRLLQIIPVLLISIFIVFVILDMTPGDPARTMLGKNASQEAVDALRDSLGLNDPLFVRYGRYILNMLKGDFGLSYKSRTSVASEVIARYPVTFKLAIGCTLWTIFIGISLGILAAVKQYSFVDNILTGFAMALASVPEFWFGMMVMLVFSVKLNLFPVTGADTALHFVLPIITLSTGSVATLIRLTRSSMLEVIRQDYITTVKAKGIRKRLIITKHALPNALIPVVTEVGRDLAGLLCGTIYVETVFGMPGLGTFLLSGVRNQDVPVVMASTVLFAVTGCIMNLIVDISYAFIDPRIKAEFD